MNAFRDKEMKICRHDAGHMTKMAAMSIYGPQREAILMSTHNIGFYEDLTKIIFELSSNTHLISSAVMKWKAV